MKVPRRFKGLTHGRRHENAVIGTEKNTMTWWSRRGLGLVFWRRSALALMLLCITPIQAFSQANNLTSPQTAAPAPLVPGTGVPGATIANPTPLAQPPASPPAAPPVAQTVPIVPVGRVALGVAARYGHDTPPIGGGLIWRV